MGSGVVNPYAFVPLGDVAPSRGEPTWHDRLRHDCLSGSFLVDICVRTPMLIGEAIEGETPPRRFGETGPAATIVPGSMLAGSIRSVHEALTNSCLRVLDLDYAPVHRQFMSSDLTKGLRMALVTGTDDEGLPTRVQLLDKEPLRVDSGAFPAASGHPRSTDDPGPGIAYSGMRLTIDAEVIRSAEGRAKKKKATVGVELQDLPHGRLLREDVQGKWMLYVSDTRARQTARVWFRAARIPDKPIVLKVPAQVRRTLARAVEGALDMHRFKDETGDFLNVYTPADAKAAVGDGHAGPVIGRRRRIHERMFAAPDVPVWVRLSGKDNQPDATRQVTEIRLAQAWRFLGDGDMPARAKGWAPCRYPESLCPSCAVFGSAGADEIDPSRGARQTAYRGHVRIEDAEHDPGRAAPRTQLGMTYRSPTLTGEFTRRPLASPKPTAGQFYLASGEYAGKTDPSQPLAQWGSSADGERDENGRRTSPRLLAGRKFYWATTSANAPDAGRGVRQEGDADEMVDRVRVVLPGSGFTTRVTVDNLTRAQIGGLLAAIDTRLLGSGWAGTIGRLGGGRPFGWGAVTMRVDPDSLDLQGPDRYTDDATSGLTVEDLVADFRRTHPSTVSPSDGDPVVHLRRILTMDAVRDADVTYPIEAGGDAFEFWKRSSGAVSRDPEPRSLGQPPLPLDLAPDAFE